MNKRFKKRTFGRKRDLREALMCSLARSFIIHEKIKTTEAKARELRPFIEKMVTKSKDDTLHSRRVLLSKMKNDNESVVKTS